MSNTQMIILRGNENCGKTTLCASVYRQLLQYANIEHSFGQVGKPMKTVKQDSIELDEKGNIRDFQALLTVGGKKIGFFSMGDYVPDYLKINIQIFINIEVAILVCCTRSRNRNNSTYRYYEETYGQLRKKIYWTEFAQNKNDVYKIKEKQAESIVQDILTELHNI